MPLTNRLFYPQVAAGVWADWVQVVNVSGEISNVKAIARNRDGIVLWYADKELNPFQGWVIPVEPVSKQQDLSLEVVSNKAIVGERHCHLGTEVLAFPGASIEMGTVGKRLFFPELVAECLDWFIVFNINNAEANVNVIVRDDNGNIVRQFSNKLRHMGSWAFSDQETGRVQGTLEIISDQLIAAERHLHYQGTYHPNGVAVGQLGQVIDIDPLPPPII
ncbi:TPA: hypothetical protein ENS27_13050 [bacterium]|nr:hypothetical protein [bacterium]